MKKFVAGLSLAAVLAFTAMPASAESLDIATIKCSDIAEMDTDTIAIILSWADGFLGGRADDTNFDIERFSANADSVVKACDQDPSKGILSILKEADAG